MAFKSFLDCLASDLGTRLKSFLSAAPGALKNHLNIDELCRVVVAAVSAGGGVFAIFQAVLSQCGAIFPAPIDAAFAALVMTLILEATRRLDHGSDLQPAPRTIRRHR